MGSNAPNLAPATGNAPAVPQANANLPAGGQNTQNAPLANQQPATQVSSIAIANSMFSALSNDTKFSPLSLAKDNWPKWKQKLLKVLGMSLSTIISLAISNNLIQPLTQLLLATGPKTTLKQYHSSPCT